ncbi:MAG: hypothetical protein QOK21_4448 [Solirubrobacteraceae bacterium]|jgi:hypothetical protein|nr:hypothetical protein [Solirubrobacteraceae bacterium]
MPTTARSHRPGSAGRSTAPRRTGASPRRPSVPGRRQPTRQVGMGGVLQRRPQKRKKNATGVAGMLGSLKGALPTGRAAKGSSSSGRGKKGAGLALATAAAGFAFSNRDKLGSMLHRNSETAGGPASTPVEPGAAGVAATGTPPAGEPRPGTPPIA